MIDKLPNGIINHILYHLLLFQFEEPANYFELKVWNEITIYPDLLALSRTCKSLKTVVYSTVFKAWACNPEDYSIGTLNYIYLYDKRLMIKQERLVWNPSAQQKYYFFFLRMADRDKMNDSFYLECHNLLMHSTYRPQFYVVAGYKDIISDALQHVQHLSLSFNSISVLHSK